jgi:hypothetical protein
VISSNPTPLPRCQSSTLDDGKVALNYGSVRQAMNFRPLSRFEQCNPGFVPFALTVCPFV